MSSNRKLRRAKQAQQRRGSAPKPQLDKNKDDVRRQTADVRFKTPGSEDLWRALLGFDTPRWHRMWLAQAIHDAVRRGGESSESARAALEDFRVRAPDAAEDLTLDELAAAIDLWRSSGDDYVAGDPAPKWELVSNLSKRIGLGEVAADTLQRDWEVFTSLTLAGAPRKALMDVLGQTEQASLLLNELTRSDNVAAVASVARILWQALAYGDTDTFERIQRWNAEWLGRGK